MSLEKMNLKFFERLLDLDYNPPQDWQDISQHLLLVVSYYSNGNTFIPSIEMRVDLSLSKLIGAVNRLFGGAKARGETVLSGRKKQEVNVASCQADICAAFQYLNIRNKPRYKSKSHIANDIRLHIESENGELLKKDKKKVASVRTIIKHMESDEKIRNDLIEMGVMKDKPILV